MRNQPGVRGDCAADFFRDGTRLTAPFNDVRLQVTGPGVKLIDQIGVATAGAPMLAVSRSDSMAYMSGMAASRA
jgi:hypothetical protein